MPKRTDFIDWDPRDAKPPDKIVRKKKVADKAQCAIPWITPSGEPLAVDKIKAKNRRDVEYRMTQIGED